MSEKAYLSKKKEPPLKKKTKPTLTNMPKIGLITRETIKEKKRCLIYPQSKFIQIWDIVIFALILYCIIVNPIEIAFIDSSQVFFVINVFVDFIFITDVVLYFFRAFERKNNELVDDRCVIVKNYLCGWFFLDLVSAFPYTLVFQTHTEVGQIVRISRLTKMTKMIRLLRFLRSIKFFNQTEKLPTCLKKLLHQDSFIKGIFRTSIFTLIMVHIVACLWKFAAEYNENVDGSNWMKSEEYVGLTDFEIYIACLYWAIQTVFTVGYGDFTPLSVFQLIISILAMLFGVFLFGTIISSISNIFESMHNHSVETISLLDNLYKFRDTYEIDDNLYQRCIEYILHRKTDVEEDYKVLFQSLPMEVRRAMNREIYSKKLKNIEYFAEKTEDFLGEIGPLLGHISFSQGDQILNKGDDAEEIYFVKSGTVSIMDSQLESTLHEFSDGKVFGEWDIFFNNGIRRFFVSAKTDCLLAFLRKEHFDEIYFQKFTDYSNSLMLESRRVFDKMVGLDVLPLQEGLYSDTEDGLSVPPPNDELVYLDNLFNMMLDLQHKLSKYQDQENKL